MHVNTVFFTNSENRHKIKNCNDLNMKHNGENHIFCNSNVKARLSSIIKLTVYNNVKRNAGNFVQKHRLESSQAEFA